MSWGGQGFGNQGQGQWGNQGQGQGQWGNQGQGQWGQGQQGQGQWGNQGQGQGQWGQGQQGQGQWGNQGQGQGQWGQGQQGQQGQWGQGQGQGQGQWGQGQQGQGQWGQGQQGQQGQWGQGQGQGQGQWGQGQQGQGQWGQGQQGQGQWGNQGQGQGQFGNQGWGGNKHQQGWGNNQQANNNPQSFQGGTFNPQPNQIYKIVLAQRQGMCLDSSGDPHAKCKLILYSHNQGNNQKWRFIPDGQGNFSIVSLQNGGTLQIPDYSNAKPGTQLHVSQPNNTINQKWKISIAKGGYSILSAFNNLSLNVLGGHCNPGDAVGLWGFENMANDTWSIFPV